MTYTGIMVKISKRIHRHLWFVIALLFSVYTQAQQPVQVGVQLIPPYSVTLSDYATATSDRLLVSLLLGDVSEFNRQVELRVAIKGNGLAVQSAPVVANTNPISLDGGVPKRLSSIDLRPYFELDNLVGISPVQYSRPLKAGLYQFCFEAYDFLTGRLLSAQSCATAYVILNDPPLLNLPVRNENITLKDPQNLIFNWTPRHINATNIQYEFTLAEIWDTNIDPQAAFLASRPIYQTTTRSTTLLYGPAQTPLLPDKTYGWRVRAIATDGISELSLFKNGGYSEVYHFNYTQQCSEPQYTLAEADGYNKAKVYWQGLDHLKYQVQYRKKDGNNSGWFEVNAYNEYAKIMQLEENTTYEYRVGGQCGYNGGYTFSRIFEFTTGVRGDNANFTCGVTPEIYIANQEPLPQIGRNEIFTAGEFPVTVKEVEGIDGVFSGWGYIVVPYLKDTRIKIGFDRIFINTDYQMTEGILVTDYDPNWEGVVSVNEELIALEDLIKDIGDAIEQLFGDGIITEEQRADELSELETLEESGRQASEDLEAANQNLENLQEEGTDEQIEQAKEDVKIKEQSVEDVREALENKSKELNARSQQGDITEDPSGFFDGYLPITYSGNGNEIITKPDSQISITIPVSDSTNVHDTFYKDYITNIKGTPYTFIYTSSNSNATDLKKAREAVANPPKDGFAIYFHYDTDKEQLGYKVEMSKEHFGTTLKEEEFEWTRAAFKRGLKNMINDLNAVEDWSAEILDMSHRLNEHRIKPLLAETKVPEEMWNPDDSNYHQTPVHMPPLGAGLTDGTLEEVTGIPQLISLVIDYNTNAQIKQQIDEAISSLDTDAVLTYAENFVKNRSELYETGTFHQIEYQSGKDVISIITVATGVKALKESVEFVKDLTSVVRRKLDNLDGVILSRSNLLKISWKNNIKGHRSSQNAFDFWKNTSKEFEHLVDGDFYLKFDKQTGNLLFGNHKTKEILGFYEGKLNIEIIKQKGLEGILGKLKGYHGAGSPSFVNLNVSSGARIIANPSKTATIVGNYKRFPWHQGDMKELIPELLGDLKTQQFGAKKGGFNVLNVADEVVSDWSKFWDEFNKPWLEEAIKRGDDIWAASDPMEINLLFKDLGGIPVDDIITPNDLADYLKKLTDTEILDEITGFGNELRLLSEKGYIYDEVSKIFRKK